MIVFIKFRKSIAIYIISRFVAILMLFFTYYCLVQKYIYFQIKKSLSDYLLINKSNYYTMNKIMFNIDLLNCWIFF